MVTHRSETPGQTQSIAASLSASLAPPACITLSGDLGAGKTTFVRGLVAGWGGDVNQVSSPTYVLLNVYQTACGPIFHLDAFRVRGPEDFEAIGFDELWDQQGLIVIEWPEKIIGLLREKTVHVRICPVSEGVRTLKIGLSEQFSEK